MPVNLRRHWLAVSALAALPVWLALPPNWHAPLRLYRLLLRLASKLVLM